jgi:pyruvate dehydrogenase phosphatase
MYTWLILIIFLNSNCPIEDDHAEMVMRSPSSTPWHFWAVIDGHVSWETSASLAERLIPSVGGALRGLYHRDPNPSSEVIDDTIKRAFVSLDNEYVYEAAERALKSDSRAQAAQLLSQAYAGAVAMLAFYDQAAGEVKVALTGDLRAVRGRPVNGQWETKTLTVEQDGDNPEEAERIRKEHPDEPDVVKNGRVLGFQPSRMFGDAQLKWSMETQQLIWKKFLGLRPRDVIKTPPYATAEPVVTTADVKAGDFLILGSDGLWESLTSEEAVTLVGAWVDEAKNAANNKSGRRSLGKKQSNLAVPTPPESKEKTIRYQYWQIPKRFVHVDDNASTHLLRNALGGADTETMSALLMRTGSLSRRLRFVLISFLTAVISCFDAPFDHSGTTLQ